MADEPTFDELCDLGAEQLADPCDPTWLDLRHQGMTADQYHRTVDVQLVGEWL
ncbi:hypothetical protein JL475_00245 [Streptomyces sp. M2CJ-2]|uniref:hypothetical protein n=1 Tax=Streptomyces sp. M2CJ-2 TaxID=2803948 RepID=UPI0019233B38|nr:hypothetical protein [Streptomyces sp. M2CJ-2]MBL3664475.1 hypothetical protein [Streptomyces sp. M2CJ-2]